MSIVVAKPSVAVTIRQYITHTFGRHGFTFMPKLVVKHKAWVVARVHKPASA